MPKETKTKTTRKASSKKSQARKKTTKKISKKTTKKKAKASAPKMSQPSTGSPKATVVILVIAIILVILASVELFTRKNNQEVVLPDDQLVVVEENDASVRAPAMAGTFYSESEAALKETVLGFVYNANNNIEGHDVPAVIVPHAAHQYSGAVAGYGYKTVANKNIRRVIILGPSHSQLFDSIAMSGYDAWRTPLGEAELADINQALLDDDIFVENEAVFNTEHSVEVQVPFVQALWPDAEIVPMIVGQMSEERRNSAAQKIAEYIDENTLLVISSDLSHYKSAEEADQIDIQTINRILTQEPEQVAKIDACGEEVILLATHIANAKGWTAHELYYSNSGDVTGDDSSVVGYASIAYTEGEAKELFSLTEVTEEQKVYLLSLARKTIETYLLTGETYVPMQPEDEFYLQEAAAFVTLNQAEELRGCVGHTVAQEALYLSVRDNALAAAFNDERFDPVTEAEIDNIDIIISILTEPAEVKLAAIEPGIDGVILGQSEKTATFLPKVWQQFDDFESFMKALSEKAGLAAPAWQTNVSFLRYRTVDFSE